MNKTEHPWSQFVDVVYSALKQEKININLLLKYYHKDIAKKNNFHELAFHKIESLLIPLSHSWKTVVLLQQSAQETIFHVKADCLICHVFWPSYTPIAWILFFCHLLQYRQPLPPHLRHLQKLLATTWINVDAAITPHQLAVTAAAEAAQIATALVKLGNQPILFMLLPKASYSLFSPYTRDLAAPLLAWGGLYGPVELQPYIHLRAANYPSNYLGEEDDILYSLLPTFFQQNPPLWHEKRRVEQDLNFTFFPIGIVFHLAKLAQIKNCLDSRLSREAAYSNVRIVLLDTGSQTAAAAAPHAFWSALLEYTQQKSPFILSLSCQNTDTTQQPTLFSVEHLVEAYSQHVLPVTLTLGQLGCLSTVCRQRIMPVLHYSCDELAPFVDCPFFYQHRSTALLSGLKHQKQQLLHTHLNIPQQLKQSQQHKLIFYVLAKIIQRFLLLHHSHNKNDSSIRSFAQRI